MDLRESHLPHIAVRSADRNGSIEQDRAGGVTADLPSSNLSGAGLGNANLPGSDLRNSYLVGADLKTAALDLADLRGDRLDDTDPSHASPESAGAPVAPGPAHLPVVARSALSTSSSVSWSKCS